MCHRESGNCAGKRLEHSNEAAGWQQHLGCVCMCTCVCGLSNPFQGSCLLSMGRTPSTSCL